MDWGYPVARPEARGDGTPRVAPRYESVQSSAEATSTDAAALLFQFAGRPDALEFSARTNAVLFTLQDEMGVELGVVLVPAGVRHASAISANRVLISSATAGAHGLAQALGKWARHRVEQSAQSEQKAAVGP